jgi:Tol biopolymer transport system component
MVKTIILIILFVVGLSPVIMQSNNYGKITFTSDRDSKDADVGYQIYVMNSDGSNQKRLISSPDSHFDPSWAPGGERIAFTLFEYGADILQVYVMDANGSSLKNISISLDDNGWPAWSPDGKRIALYAYNNGAPGLYVMRADGSNNVNLTNRGWLDREPSWSPDGEKIAFTPGNAIYVINADGSNMKRLIIDATNPAWSPDGEKIAFCSDRDGNWEIYVMDADGRNETNLTSNPAHDMDPTWSPDGEKIAFTSDRDGNDEIYVMNADGTHQMNLTSNPCDDRDPDWCCQCLIEPSFTGKYVIVIAAAIAAVLLALVFLMKNR